MYLPVALPTGSLAQAPSSGGSRRLQLRRCRSRTGMYPSTPVGARVKPLTRAWICPDLVLPSAPHPAKAATRCLFTVRLLLSRWV